MLERPPIPDEAIAECLAEQYGLTVTASTFLPRGFDVDAAAFHAALRTGDDVFVKVRRDGWNPAALTVPRALRDLGITAVVAPVRTTSGALMANVAGFGLAVYPFIEGASGWGRALTAAQWREFGRTVRAIHAAALPGDVLRMLPRETFNSSWRDRARARAAGAWRPTADEIEREFAEAWRSHRDEIERLLDAAETCADDLRARDLPHVPCHTDLHGDNLLIGADGSLHIVDWDDVMLAPKERDLMFIGGAIGGAWREPAEVEAFYAGYGAPQMQPVDLAALAYYRCERAIVDFVEFSEQIASPTPANAGDRAAALRFFTGSFGPGCEVQIALETAQRWRLGRR